MTFGMNHLRHWLISLIPDLSPKPRAGQRDCCDYDLPLPRICPERLPITRPSTPFLASEPKRAVPSLDSLSANRVTPPLLELLPLEIRQKIWLLVLGGRTLHLVLLSDCLGCVHCLSVDPDTCGGECARDRPGEWMHDENGDYRPPLSEEAGRPLRLLMTCRQIYTEAIDILYSSNTFDVSHAATVEYLPLALLRRRLNTIRTLRISCNFSGHPPVDLSYRLQSFSGDDLRVLSKRKEKWQSIWSIISAMAGLRRLHVKLYVNHEWDTFNRESAGELLGPVKQVTRPELFVLSIPVSAMYEGMPRPSTQAPWAARNGWEGSDPWDDLRNCKIRRVGTVDEL